ncbi:MAG TPA: hypothetical protein VD741_03145, partial [Solirubrobacterales bacterium]|nr:hypothetical protein [Solirubrobacterales bacterium]
SLDGRVTFDRQVSGQRVYDVNVDGVAHYGLYPDWMEQLRLLAGEPIADDLMSGAEAYLQTWERAIGVPGPTGAPVPIGAPESTCLATPRRLSRSGAGPLKLGLTPEQTLLAAGQPLQRVNRSFRWCSTRARARGAQEAGVAVVFDAGEKAAFVATTTAGNGKPKGATKLGRGLFVARSGSSGDRVWAYREGKLRFSAVAVPRLAGKASRIRAAFRESGLR